MKKIISMFLTVVLLMTMFFAVTAAPASAASYPLISYSTYKSTNTMVKGTIGKLAFTIFHEYKNERYNIEVYNSKGSLVASVSDDMYCTSYFRDLTITVNTSKLDLDVGTYTVKYWMEYYTFFEWRTAPRTYSATFKVINSKCGDKHKYTTTVVSEGTCKSNGWNKKACSVCGYYTYEETYGEHTYDSGTVVTAPTTTKKGVKRLTCKECKQTKDVSLSGVKITKQPASVSVVNGSKATVKLTATGEGLTYKWYFKNKGASSYSVSSTYKSNSYSLTMDNAKNGRQVYCVVKDKYGNEVKSNVVTFKMTPTVAKITKQPVSTYVAKGKTVKVTVGASGDGLTYKWYFKNKGASKYSVSTSAKGNSYSLTMDNSRDGRSVYCVVTDQYGNSKKSNVVTIGINKNNLKIKTQPVNSYVLKGKTAKATVSASGDGLTYKWYFKNKGASSYSVSSITGKTYSTTMDATKDGRQVYCVVTDKYGNTKKTNVVTIGINKNNLKIKTQPVNSYVLKGKTAKVSVVASGDGLTYKWYFKNKGASSYSVSSTYKGANYSLTMDNIKNGRQVYCVITDKYGNTKKTKVVTVGIKK